MKTIRVAAVVTALLLLQFAWWRQGLHGRLASLDRPVPVVARQHDGRHHHHSCSSDEFLIHGSNGSALNDDHRLTCLLFATLDLLHAADVDYWLEFSTLLSYVRWRDNLKPLHDSNTTTNNGSVVGGGGGFVRGGNLLDASWWEYDVDVSIMESDAPMVMAAAERRHLPCVVYAPNRPPPNITAPSLTFYNSSLMHAGYGHKYGLLLSPPPLLSPPSPSSSPLTPSPSSPSSSSTLAPSSVVMNADVYTYKKRTPGDGLAIGLAPWACGSKDCLDVPAHLIFPLQRVEFLGGAHVMVPAKPVEYLRFRYNYLGTGSVKDADTGWYYPVARPLDASPPPTTPPPPSPPVPVVGGR